MHLRSIGPSVYASWVYRTFGLCILGLSDLWSIGTFGLVHLGSYRDLWSISTFSLCILGLLNLRSIRYLRSIGEDPPLTLYSKPKQSKSMVNGALLRFSTLHQHSTYFTSATGYGIYLQQGTLSSQAR